MLYIFFIFKKIELYFLQMYGLYDKEGILRFVDSDKDACIAYAELFELGSTNYCLMDLANDTKKVNDEIKLEESLLNEIITEEEKKRIDEIDKKAKISKNVKIGPFWNFNLSSDKMLYPRTSLGNKSDVNWILLKLSPKLDVIALANVVFPEPG